MSTPTPVSEYKCVIITVTGRTDQAVLITGQGRYFTRDIPKSRVLINDPADVSLCVPSTDVDEEFWERCYRATFVFAWVPDWLIFSENLTEHVEPARPPVSAGS